MSIADIGMYSYLFTQGLLGKMQDGKITLTAGSFSYKTNFSDDFNDYMSIGKAV